MKNIPARSEDLIFQLAEEYPQKCVKKSEDINNFKWYCAKAELVNELLLQLNRQLRK